jgi:hypothetical protein
MTPDFALLRAHGLVHLPEHEALVGVGLQLDRALTAAGHELARAGEEQVAGEDGDVVAPHRLRARDAAALVGAVHDVVVVQRAEMGQLERRGDLDDLFRGALTELRGQDGEHRSHTLAAGLVEVAGGDVGELVGAAHLALELGLDAREARLDGGEEGARTQACEDAVTQAQLARQAGAGRGRSRGHGFSLSWRAEGPPTVSRRLTGVKKRDGCRGAARRCRR